MFNRLYLVVFCYICLVAPLLAQSPVLEAYIQEGLNGNLALQEKQFDIEKSRAAVRQAKALFAPTFTFDANYTVAGGGRKIDFPIGDLLNPVYGTLNQLTQSNNFPVLENQQIQFLPNNFQETKISFAYPLYNTDLKYNQHIQDQLLLTKTATKTAFEHELRYTITEVYIQYLQTTSALEIWDQSKKVLQELRRFNESLVNNNVATRDVVASADYELSKADGEIAKITLARENAKAYFNSLINRPLNEEITVDTSMLRAPVYNVVSSTLVEQALNNRAEFDALKAGIEAANINVKRNESNIKIPDFYIGGSVGFQGFGYKMNSDQLYGLAQVGMTYDIYDNGLRKSKVQEAKIDAAKVQNQLAQTQQRISLQVTIAQNEKISAMQAYQTTVAGVTAAESGFKIINNKYKAGQILLLEYMEAQNKVTTAKLQRLIAWTNVLWADARLQKAVGQ